MSLAVFPEGLCQCEGKVEGCMSQNKLKRKSSGKMVDWQRIETQSKEMANCYLIYSMFRERVSVLLISKQNGSTLKFHNKIIFNCNNIQETRACALYFEVIAGWFPWTLRPWKSLTLIKKMRAVSERWKCPCGHLLGTCLWRIWAQHIHSHIPKQRTCIDFFFSPHPFNQSKCSFIAA